MLRNNRIAAIKNFQLKALLILFLFSFSKSWGQTIVADDFENTTTLFSNTGVSYYSGNSAAGDRPASVSFAQSGTYGAGVTSGTAVFTSSLINTSSCTNPQLSLRLASFSIGSTGNGADGTDYCRIDISNNGGISYVTTLEVDGNANAYWGFTTSTGTASTSYGTPLTIAPTGGGARTTDGYSTLIITNLPSVSNLVIRITLFNNASAERWVIDNFVLSGSCSSCSAPTTTITPTTQTVCVGAATTISVTSSAASNTYTWQASATSGGVYSNVSNGTPAGSSYSGTNTAVLSLTAGATYYYRCLVTDVTGSCTATSGTSTLVVNTTPTITTQPSSTVVCQGSTATIKVTMNSASSSPLTYQWQENTGSGFTNISIGSPYTVGVGTNTSTLNVDNTKPIGTYTYQCIVSNSCGTVTTSIVTVTITATPANDLCSSATPIVIDASPVIGSLTCASPSSGLTYAATKNDVWYAFTPTCTASHTVTMNFTTSGADYDLDVFTTGACPASGTATYTSHGTTTVETISQTFTSGVTYYIRVIDYNTSGGTFSISVVSNCGSPHVVTFDSNGGSGTMSNQTSSSATSLTSNAFTNSGCTFVAWNDSANANGTSYANTAVYSFTSNVTLYAQWNCSSGGGSTGCPYLVSAVVNACSGSCGAEGNNEIVVMNSGSYAIPVNGSNINLYYSGGTNHYFTNSFAASSGTVVSNLNTITSVSGCSNTFTFVPSGGTIPANSNFIILNKNSCFTGDFSPYCGQGPIYVVISTSAVWSPTGFFGNNSSTRWFKTNFSYLNASCGITTYSYNTTNSFGFSSDGASVTFNGTTPSYITGDGTCVPPLAILPIELIDFYATQDGGKNNLVWKVASEKNVLQYIVEKSDDGVNFIELSRVKANSNENVNQTYQIEDNSPNAEITYYRLSTLENTNEVKHYKIIDVDKHNKNWESLLYQTADELVLEFKNLVPKDAQLLLFDLSGKLISKSVVEKTTTKMNVINLATGIYFAKIESPYKTENFKIIIQNDK